MNEKTKTRPGANGMAIASLIMGIMAIPAGIVLLGGIFTGLGITFALLSRGDEKMSGVAVAGLICSLVALVPGLVIGLFLLSFSGGGTALLPPGDFLGDLPVNLPTLMGIMMF